MTDEPEIVKELRESEKLGRIQSTMQSTYEELDAVEAPSEDVPDKTIAFTGNTAERTTGENTTHYDVKTEKLYRSIVELSPDSIVTVDLKGVVTSCNTAGLKMMGYSRDEIVGKHFTKIGIFREKDNLQYLELFSSVTKAKNFGPIEIEFRRKDGTSFFGEVRVAQLKEGDIVIGIQTITRDITEHKKMEETQQENEEKFRLIFENAKEAFFWVDFKTSLIIKCNKSAEILLEKKREEIVGQHQKMLYPSQKAKYYIDMFKKHIKPGASADYEAEIITKSGRIKPVHITASITVIGGKSIIQGLFHDITNQKKAEDELKKKFDELETFHNIAINRELKMIELKKEINELCKKYGEKPRYIEEAENMEMK